MKIFMKVVLIVAVIAIIAGVVGGVVTANERKNEQESLKLERQEMREQYENGEIDLEDIDKDAHGMMGKGGRSMTDKDGSGNSAGMKGGRGFNRPDADSEAAEE